MNMRRIMLVDDEPNVLHALARALSLHLRDAQVRVVCVDDPRRALERALEATYDVVISDFRMPHMDGVELLKRVREIQPDTVRLILSASTDFETVRNAVNEAEVFRYIAKPWDMDELESAVRLAFERRDHLVEERRLADEARLQRGMLSPADAEARRLEQDEPGITRVRFDADGGVLLQ